MLAAAVAFSILGLALGPIFLAWSSGRVLPSAAIDGLTLGLVPAVVLLRLMPHVHEEVGPLTLGLVAAGYLGLWNVERRRHGAFGRLGQVVALPALLVHATADGATLGVVLGPGAAAVETGALLAAAVLLHRVPEGLFVARAIVPASGWRRAVAWLAALSVATCVGALLGERALSLAPHHVFHGVVAVGLGAILRLATHTHGRAPATRREIAVFVVAIAVGLGVNALVPAAELREAGEAPAHDPRAAVLAGSVAVVLLVALGLLRVAPRALRVRLGLSDGCDPPRRSVREPDPAPSGGGPPP